MDLDFVKIDLVNDLVNDFSLIKEFGRKIDQIQIENDLNTNESYYRGLNKKLDDLKKELLKSNDKIIEEKIRESIKLLIEEIIYRENVIKDIKMRSYSIQ